VVAAEKAKAKHATPAQDPSGFKLKKTNVLLSTIHRLKQKTDQI
jgi:hypothetical protein